MRQIFICICLAWGVILIATGAGLPSDMEVRETGIGPVTAQTPFEREIVQQLFPELLVQDGVGSSEGEQYPTITVSDKDGELFEILPDSTELNTIHHIGRIFVKSDHLLNGLGHKIGQTHQQVFGDAKPECRAQGEELSGTALCHAPQSNHIFYIFRFDESRRKGDGLPPVAVLRKSVLEGVVWVP